MPFSRLKPIKHYCLTLSALAVLTACGGSDSADHNPAANNQSNSNSPLQINAGYAVSDEEADRRARSMLSMLSLQEKIDLVHGHGSPVGQLGYTGLNYPQVPGAMDLAVGYIPGIEAIGLPKNNMVDGSSGVTAEGLEATALPATIGLAATWSKQLAHDFGARVGAEARLLGFTTVLGGGINLTREPRSGRGFEFMGEDPILAGELGAERTIGVQENKVLSTIKHFAFNNMETNRMVANSIVDEQTMRETELLAFEIAITKGKPAYIMCSYNQVNGVHACENEYLLSEVLKGDWGFKGVVMSDWGAQSSTVDAALNGLDEEQPGQEAQDTEIPRFMSLYMGGPWFIDDLYAAVTDGRVPMSRLDDMVFRKLRTMIAIGLVDEPPQPRVRVDETAGNHDAKRIADATMVLMQNNIPEGESTPVLPLSKAEVTSILIVGNDADKGVLSGGGSGGAAPLIENQVDKCGQLPISPYPTCPTYIGVTPVTAITAEFPNAEVTYLDGNDTAAAVAAAEQADVTILMAGAWFNEGVDNTDMYLPGPETDRSGVFTYNQDEMISAVAAAANHSVVVLQTGQPVLLPWAQEVDAILNAWYPGVEGGYAIADVLSGDVNPSGKLPVTFPASEADLVHPQMPTNLGRFLGIDSMIKTLSNTVENIVNANLGEGMYDILRRINYSENLAWNGYKWLDSHNIQPAFAFGHGLSYSEYVYSEPSVTRLTNGDVSVTFNIDNASNRAGIEIAQVYVSLPDDVPGLEQPPKNLVGWTRTEIAPQSVETVTVTIPQKYLSTWDVDADEWVLNPGTYRFTIADTSDVSHTSNALVTSIDVQ